MLGQAHTPRRRLVALAVLALSCLAIPAIGGANPSQDAQALRALDAQLAAKQRSAVLGVYALDRQLAGAAARLDALRAQTVSLRAQESRLRLEERLARHDTTLAQAHLAVRLQNLYEQGTPSSMEILLGASSLDQALNELDTIDSATSADQSVLKEVKAARVQLDRASRSLAARRAALARATQSVQATATALVVARSRRQGYIADLASRRRLTEQQVVRVVAQAHAAAARSARIQQASFAAVSAPSPAEAAAAGAPATPSAVTPVAAPAPAAPAPASVPAPAGGRTLTVTATGYALTGTTATGLPVGWGVAAVDPSVIPLGTHMAVPGYGEAVAADTGGGVGGDTIDLWFPTAAQAEAWGRRTVTIVLH